MNTQDERLRTTGALAWLRSRNRQTILSALAHHGELSQRELATITSLSQASISNIIRDLAAESSIIVSVGKRNGRRVHLITQAPANSTISIGIHITRTTIRALSLHGNQVIKESEVKIRPASRDYTCELPTLQELIHCLQGTEYAISGIGIACGAAVESDHGRIARIPGWERLELPGFPRSWLDADICKDVSSLNGGVPVELINDGDAAALAESRFGAGSEMNDVLYIYLGEGVGGGIVLGRRLYTGGSGRIPSEIGHLSSDRNGPLCHCGNRGCLELSLGRALVQKYESVSGGPMSTKDFVDAARSGDPAANRLLAEAARIIIDALENIIGIMVPQRVIIGGPFARAGDALLRPLREAVNTKSLGLFWSGEITLGSLVEKASALGAAIAAVESESRNYVLS